MPPKYRACVTVAAVAIVRIKTFSNICARKRERERWNEKN